MGRPARNEHSTLLRTFVNYGRKKSYDIVPRAYSRQGEIEDYLFGFAKKFDLLRYITFDTRVTQIEWNENKQVIFVS